MADDESTDRLKRLRREPPRFRRLRVRSVSGLSPHMTRVVLAGPDLDGFAIQAPASSVRLLLPSPGETELVMPEWTGNQFELPDGRRAPIRTFTPRHHDADRRELTLDIVLHENGAATDWVRGASIDDEAAISGPGRSEPLDPAVRSYLLAGDESAIPAIAQLLEAIDPACTVRVIAEATSSDAVLDLPEHAGADVEWVIATHDGPPGSAMAALVESVDELPEHVWIAGEAACVQRLRTHLFDQRERSRASVTARGYWKRGRAAT